MLLQEAGKAESKLALKMLCSEEELDLTPTSNRLLQASPALDEASLRDAVAGARARLRLLEPHPRHSAARHPEGH